MLKLQKLWCNLLCLLGQHDWSAWRSCEDLFNEWRVCPWCHTEERRRTYLGKLHDLTETQYLQEFMASVDEIAIAAIRTQPPQEE